MPAQFDEPPKATEHEVKLVVENFLSQIDSILKRFEDVDDQSTQQALKQLQDIKEILEGTKQVDDKTSSWDLPTLGTNLLLAAEWIKFVIELCK